MSTRTFGEPVKRNEDRRLLTGQALFIDDIELPGMLHVAFLRSQIAHAKFISIDVSGALRRPGVVAAYVAGDLGDYWQPGPILVPPPPIAGIVFHERTPVPLARDKDRHSRDRREPLYRRGCARRYRCRTRAATGGGRSGKRLKRRIGAGSRGRRLQRFS